MNAQLEHLHVSGPRATDRRARMAALSPADVTAGCHRGLRGPFTGLGPVLALILPEAYQRWPELVDAHRQQLTYLVPDVAAIIGPPAPTLVATTPHEERTRFFSSQLIRGMSQGVVTFLDAIAARRDFGRLTLAFDAADQADQTEQEFLALLLRRCDPARLRVLIGTGAGTGACPELTAMLAEHARTVAVPARSRPESRSQPELLTAFLASDGTSDDPAEQAAYALAAATDPDAVAVRHDRRAEELRELPGLGTALGALPYHAERGTDPTGRGRAAVRMALEHCVAQGFSEATIDFGTRGRALCDPVTDQKDYCHFTAKAASALIPLNRESEAEALFVELRCRYPLPRVQMIASYGLAMLHTRFFAARDHDLALAHQNNAVALASLETGDLAPLFQVFQDNALALVEVHRKNPARALELVTRGLQRLDAELGPEQHLVHRSQLLHNRSRVLSMIGDRAAAEAELTRLIELDPNFLEYHTDRGNVRFRRGDLAGALADYDQAVTVGPPMPELYFNRGNLRTEAGDQAGAVADFGYVVELDPGHLDARVNLATLLLQAGLLPDAGAVIEAGLRGQPGDPRLLCTLALIEQERDEKDAAAAAFELALAADPGFVAALAGRALLRFEAGDVTGALTDLDAAVLLSGDDPDLLFNRGVALLEAGRPEDAARDFDRAIDLPGADRDELRAQRARCPVVQTR